MVSFTNNNEMSYAESSDQSTESKSRIKLILPLGVNNSITETSAIPTNELDKLGVALECENSDSDSNDDTDDTTMESMHANELLQEVDTDLAVVRRRRYFSIFVKVGCTIYLCANILLPLSKPYERRMEARSVPFSSRRINININLPFPTIIHGRKLVHRLLDEDEDSNDSDSEDNDDANSEDNDDGSQDGKDDDAEADDQAVDDQAVDDPYYDPYYVEEEEEEEEEEVIDDFYRYIDDDIERRTILPIEFNDVAGLLCTCTSIFLSIGGGIGPGAILVGVYIIVMDFPPKVAIPLSCITSLGISMVSTITNAPKRHPLTDRPMIDWDLILIMQPLTLFGAITGTYLNKILAEKVIVTLLVLLLSIIAHNTLKRARRMHYAEQLYIKRIQWAKTKKKNTDQASSIYQSNSFGGGLAEADPPFLPKVHSINSPQNSPTRDNNRSRNNTGTSSPGGNRHNEDTRSGRGGTTSSLNSSFSSFIVLHHGNAESVKSSLIEEEADPLPQNKITYIVAMFLFVIAMNVFKGGGAFESPLGITCGSLSFWTVEVMTATWLIGCTFIASRFLLRRHAIKEAVGFDYVRGDIRWDVRTTVIYPAVCIVAGLVSGMFGIGCAIVIGPMLVGIGVNPSVAAATCGCLNFFTSLAATSSYVVLGSVIPDSQYAVVCFLLGITASFFGGKILSRTVTSTKIKKNKRLERHSYMAYSMGLVVLVSALSMTVEALLSVVSHRFDTAEKDGICEIEGLY